MTMAMVISPKRPTPTTKMTTTKRTTIIKNISNNKMVDTTQTINSNNKMVGATTMNRGYWIKSLVNTANTQQRLL